MYIAMNRFTVNPGFGEAFEQRWRDRESNLAQVPGFLRFRLLKLDDALYSSYAEWESEAAFAAWTQSEAFRKSHGSPRPPAGMFAGPPRLECWNVILEQ